LADWTSEIRALLEGLELDPARQCEIAEELGQHLSDRCEELGREGLTVEEARRTALAEARDGRLIAELRRLKRPASLDVAGVDEAGFRITELPAISAGAIFHAGIASGKFQGVTHATTPSGWRVVKANFVADSEPDV